MPEQWRQLLCDPQTSGGLLVAVDPAADEAFLAVARAEGLNLQPIGELLEHRGGPWVEVV